MSFTVSSNQDENFLFVDFNEVEKRVDSLGSCLDSANFIFGFAIFWQTQYNDFLGCVRVVKKMKRAAVDLETGTGALILGELNVFALNSLYKL